MKNKQITCMLSLSILLLLIAPPFAAMTNTESYGTLPKHIPTGQNILGNEYNGYLRIYVVEIESRWKMENRRPYHYAFLEFVHNNQLSIRYQETYTNTFTWSGDVDEDNVIVMAALFNPEPNKNYADPPLGRIFNAYYVDAAAAAHPGETAYNTVNAEFTHTVFCEVGTATWCPSCPSMANELDDVYESGKYPFYYVEMVTDVNSVANQRMGNYNLKWLPTAFYDGGNEVVVGGGNGEKYHENIIKTIGKRDVHELNLTLAVNWISEGNLSIDVEITNNEALPNNPPEKPIITGPSEGKKGEVQTFNISAVDPDGDEIYLLIDWADNTTNDWIGPYSSGKQVQVNHTWSSEGIYIVKIKAKDLDNAESDWGQLKVTMPKMHSYNPIFQLFIKKLGRLQFFSPFLTS